MKIIIEAEPKELAALVLAAQERRVCLRRSEVRELENVAIRGFRANFEALGKGFSR